MSTSKIIIAVLIHLIIPLAGLLLYLHLRKRMKSEKLENAPNNELFILFATYGGLITVALTSLFWEWSGMASLGTFYLILGAPIVMGVIAYRNYNLRKTSKYHLWIYNLCIAYYVIAPLIIISLIKFGNIN